MNVKDEIAFGWFARYYILLVSLLFSPALILLSEVKESEQQAQITRVFKGLDLYAKAEDLDYAVVGFQRNRILGTRDGKLYSISMDNPIRYEYGSKMTTRWVDYELLNVEPFNSRYLRDYRALQTTTSQLEFETGRYDVLASSYHRTGSRYSPILNGVNSVSGSPADAAVDAFGRIETFDNLRYELESRLQNEDEYTDALRVKLKLTPAQEIANAYVVVLAFHKSPGDSFTSQRPLNKVLGKLKAHQPKVFVLEFDGFPEGYQMAGLEVHLYSRGVEIPHQGSPGLLEMTDQETYEYLLTKYKMSGGKAEPILYKPLSGDGIKGILSSDELQQIKVELIVRANGSATVDFIDAEDSRRMSGLVSFLEQVRFFPAMQNGDAVESKLFVPLVSIVRVD